MLRSRTRTTALAAGLLVALGAIGGGAALASAGGDDDSGDAPITGAALERATAAALAHTGPGRVTGTELGDEDSVYEVEVTLADGRRVDVQLDERFRVLDSGLDVDGAASTGDLRGR